SYSPPPTCFDPNSVTLTSTLSTATVNILDTNNSNATYNIQYGPLGFGIGAGITVSSVNSPYTITNLAQDQYYDVWVQADCDTNGLSSWVGPYSFNTILGYDCSFPDLITSLPYSKNGLSTANMGNPVTTSTAPCSFYFMGGND